MSRAPLRHPDQEHVRNLVQEIVLESKAAGWTVEMLQFDFYKSRYNVKLMLEGHHAQAAIPTEWIDDVWNEDNPFKRRRIKRILKEAVAEFADLGD